MCFLDNSSIAMTPSPSFGNVPRQSYDNAFTKFMESASMFLDNPNPRTTCEQIRRHRFVPSVITPYSIHQTCPRNQFRLNSNVDIPPISYTVAPQTNPIPSPTSAPVPPHAHASPHVPISSPAHTTAVERVRATRVTARTNHGGATNNGNVVVNSNGNVGSNADTDVNGAENENENDDDDDDDGDDDDDDDDNDANSFDADMRDTSSDVRPRVNASYENDIVANCMIPCSIVPRNAERTTVSRKANTSGGHSVSSGWVSNNTGRTIRTSGRYESGTRMMKTRRSRSPVSSYTVPLQKKSDTKGMKRKTPRRTKVYVCDDCGRTFNHRGHFNEHRQCVHDKVKQHKCVFLSCRRAFFKKSDRDRHIYIKHQGVAECQGCLENFPNLQALLNHDSNCANIRKRFQRTDTLNSGCLPSNESISSHASS